MPGGRKQWQGVPPDGCFNKLPHHGCWGNKAMHFPMQAYLHQLWTLPGQQLACLHPSAYDKRPFLKMAGVTWLACFTTSASTCDRVCARSGLRVIGLEQLRRQRMSQMQSQAAWRTQLQQQGHGQLVEANAQSLVVRVCKVRSGHLCVQVAISHMAHLKSRRVSSQTQCLRGAPALPTACMQAAHKPPCFLWARGVAEPTPKLVLHTVRLHGGTLSRCLQSRLLAHTSPASFCCAHHSQRVE